MLTQYGATSQCRLKLRALFLLEVSSTFTIHNICYLVNWIFFLAIVAGQTVICMHSPILPSLDMRFHNHAHAFSYSELIILMAWWDTPMFQQECHTVSDWTVLWLMDVSWWHAKLTTVFTGSQSLDYHVWGCMKSMAYDCKMGTK
jgi:uncharacterized metal-binding protein